MTQTLSKLKNKKATGPDLITSELIKGGSDYGRHENSAHSEHLADTEGIRVMKKANIILITKITPSSANLEEQRPILLLNIWYKVLHDLVKRRIDVDVNR